MLPLVPDFLIPRDTPKGVGVTYNKRFFEPSNTRQLLKRRIGFAIMGVFVEPV
jgi:hypothetical protein